jgi:hypothetical protein
MARQALFERAVKQLECQLLVVKQKARELDFRSGFDPQRTFGAQF